MTDCPICNMPFPWNKQAHECVKVAFGLMCLRDVCNQTVARYKKGKVSKAESLRQLFVLEKYAYESNPDAEPDGEITYTVALAVEEIDPTSKSQSQVSEYEG